MKRTAQLSAKEKSIQMDRTVDQVIALTTANNLLSAKVNELTDAVNALTDIVRTLEARSVASVN